MIDDPPPIASCTPFINVDTVMSTSSTPTTNFKLSSLAKFRNWKWGFSEKRGSGGSLIMETLPTFPLIFLGSKNSGKESLFNRIVADRFHQKNIASSAAASKCIDPSRYRMKQTDGGVLTGIRSIQVGSGKYATTCWSEVLCCKGNSFSETSYPLIEDLWGRMRGAVLIVDALAAFANGTIESSINHMINVCNRMERECLGVETQLMIVVTKCDLLYEECGLTAKEIFDDTMK